MQECLLISLMTDNIPKAIIEVNGGTTAPTIKINSIGAICSTVRTAEQQKLYHNLFYYMFIICLFVYFVKSILKHK